jgi:hypothetical protein
MALFNGKSHLSNTISVVSIGRRVDSGEIDHFAPWSRYPRDLAHNLVLAHKVCNRQKSDLLAAETHLDEWLLRNEAHSSTTSLHGMRYALFRGTESIQGFSRGTRAFA